MDNSSAALRDFAEMIREAGIAKKRIHILGGGTHSFVQGEHSYSTKLLNTVTEYAPDDLTITVEAGLPWVELQKTIKDHHQWLPVEPPGNEKSTVGGVVAVNASGPSRYRYGSLRNWLIGARFITANSDIVHSGSKVVKSVAGYDVHKLLIGSFGSLAAIAELTFKVAPLPERRVIVTIHADSLTDLLPILTTRLHEVSPTFAIYCNKLFAEQSLLTINANSLLIGLDGFTEDIEMQIKKLRQLFASQHADFTVSDMDLNQLNPDILSFTLGKQSAVRIASLPSDIATLVPTLNDFPAIIDIANGTADVVPDDDAHASSLSTAVIANGLHGVYLWQNDQAVAIGGVPDAEKKLAHRLKETFDPHGVFNQRGYYL
ncbi:MAG TPA: FAD-binding oxidoreductase [Candidatus Kapabacteria bacterium]|nr:FAD-binding oxidoreductase [Candidatus Kapabacteria bacterium]